MIFKRKKKNNLDEFQEQKLLHIERDSFWILYWVLAAVMVVQLAMGCDPRDAAGEWISFMLISLVMVLRCIKNGLWDRRFKPDHRTNVISSIIAAVVVFFLSVLIIIRVKDADVRIAVISGGISAGITLAVTYIALTVLGGVYKKRLQQLEERED